MNEPVTYDKVELVHPGVVPLKNKMRYIAKDFFLYNEGGTATTIALYVDVKGFSFNKKCEKCVK